MTYADLNIGNFSANILSLSGPSLVTLYNEMAMTAHDLGDSERPAVVRFASAEKGRSRVEALHLHILGLRRKAGKVNAPAAMMQEALGGAEARAAEQDTASPSGDAAAHDADQPESAAGEQTAVTEGEAPASDESEDDMAKKAKAKKGAGAKRAPAPRKRAEGPSLADYTKEWNDLVPGAVKAGVKGVKKHTSPFETKEKAAARIKWLKDAIRKAG